MKIKDSFILSEIGDSYIVIPTGAETVDLNGMITLNETGAYFFKKMENEISKEELCEEILKDFEDVNREDILKDIDEFTEKLRKIGALSE